MLLLSFLRPGYHEGRGERERNALSVLANLVKVGVFGYIPILLVLRALLYPSGGHFTADGFKLCFSYHSVQYSWSATILIQHGKDVGEAMNERAMDGHKNNKKTFWLTSNKI